MRTTTPLLALLLAAPFSALAAPYPAEGVTAQELADLLRSEGYQAVVTTTNNGSPKINSGASGVNFSIVLHGCNPSGRCADLEINAGWTNSDIPLEKVNQWNTEKRYLQASWAQGKVYAEWDVIARHSSSEQMTVVIARWGSLIGEFRKFMNL